LRATLNFIWTEKIFATIADVWFEIKGEEGGEHDLLDKITDENAASVFQFLLRHKLGWHHYLKGRNDVVRIYYEDIVAKNGLREIVADLLPQADLWPEVEKQIASGAWYEDTFFVPGSVSAKKQARECILDLITSSQAVSMLIDDRTCFFPMFLAPYEEQIKLAVQSNIDLFPFVRYR
jgi:hypothetical protein